MCIKVHIGGITGPAVEHQGSPVTVGDMLCILCIVYIHYMCINVHIGGITGPGVQHQGAPTAGYSRSAASSCAHPGSAGLHRHAELLPVGQPHRRTLPDTENNVWCTLPDTGDNVKYTLPDTGGLGNIRPSCLILLVCIMFGAHCPIQGV